MPQELHRQSVVHGEQVGCDQKLANVMPSDCGLEEDLTIFAEGKGVTSASEGRAKGSEGEQ